MRIHVFIYLSIHTDMYIYLMAAATAADPKESHHGFVEGTGRYYSNGKGRAAEDGLWYRGLPSGTV